VSGAGLAVYVAAIAFANVAVFAAVLWEYRRTLLMELRFALPLLVRVTTDRKYTWHRNHADSPDFGYTDWISYFGGPTIYEARVEWGYNMVARRGHAKRAAILRGYLSILLMALPHRLYRYCAISTRHVTNRTRRLHAYDADRFSWQASNIIPLFNRTKYLIRDDYARRGWYETLQAI
jgi:hypothetical protein